MKKKIILGLFAIVSAFAFAQVTNESVRRPFWGYGSSTPDYYDNCQPTGQGQATGEPIILIMFFGLDLILRNLK